MSKEMGEEDLKRVEVRLEKVDGDDYGDEQWQWHAVWTLDNHAIWDDYYRTKPDKATLAATLETVNDGGCLSK